MTGEQALLLALLDDADADAPRLVYADWLEEHGDAERAEFIRVQIELASLAPAADRHARLTTREQALLQGHRAEWARPLEPYGHVAAFSRGFPERLALGCLMDRTPWLEHLAAALAGAPIAELRLDAQGAAWPDRPPRRWVPLPPVSESDLERLAASPLLGRLRSLDINCRGLLLGDPGDFRPGLRALADSPHAGRLRALSLDGHWGLGPDALGVLAPSARLSALAELGLAGTGLRDEDLAALPNSPLGARLARLDCTHNPRITAAGAALLLGGRALPVLTALDLDTAGVSATGVRPLLGAPGLTRLRRLRFQSEQDISGEDPSERHEALQLDGLVDLLVEPGLAGLEELILQGIRLDEGALVAMTNGPLAGRLVALTLHRCLLGDDCLPMLGNLLVRGRLRRLSLAWNYLTDAGAKALANERGLSGLHELDLTGNDLTEAGLQALRTSPHRHPWLRLVAGRA